MTPERLSQSADGPSPDRRRAPALDPIPLPLPERSPSQERGGATRISGFNPDLPAYTFQSPTIISDGALFNTNQKLVQDYVAHWIRNPDKGSSFDKATRYVRWLPNKALFGLMRLMKYDGLVFTKPGQVVAHTFFQQHGKDLHMFSISVNPEFRGQGLARKAAEAFIEHARAREGIERIRLGAGGHAIVQHICEKLASRENQFNVEAEGNQFFRFRDKSA